MLDAPKISLAYAAGYIDGDGSVCVSESARRHNVSVYVAGTDKPTLELFQNAFGGTLNTNVDSRNSKWKPVHIWRKSISQDGRFLRDLHPNLFLKREQARLCLDLVARKGGQQQRNPWPRGGFSSMPESEFKDREVLATTISHLNSLSCSCPHEGTPSLEYFAGFFDAEGCVGVYRYKKTAHRIQVNVSNRCTWILRKFKERFDGCFGTAHGGHQWQTSARKAESFLEAILPYLRLKQDRAKNALELYKNVGINNGWHFRNSDSVNVEELKNTSNEMNRKCVLEVA